MTIRAVVQKVVPEGKHGAYAVATSEEFEGSITFSLDRSVWQETGLPERGTIVLLSDLQMKRAGWRAMSGRFLRPSDQQPATSKSARSKTMKVCTCCYNAEVISGSRNPFEAWFDNYIVLPADTPVQGPANDLCVSGKFLETAGLKWKDSWWCKPDGEPILGPYDMTITESREMEPWERDLFADEKNKVIPFLKSHPKDNATLGRGVHEKRQAKVLLKFFDEHIVAGFKPQGLGEFSGSYPKTKEINLSNPSVRNFDIEGLQALRQTIEADQRRLAELGLEPISNDERVKRYCFKLRWGLATNLGDLEVATQMTESGYQMTDRLPNAGIGVFLATFAARHQTNQTGVAVRSLYSVMLPILVAKLVEAGYQDVDGKIEWEYNEA